MTSVSSIWMMYWYTALVKCYLGHLKLIFQKIKESGLKLKHWKCSLFKRHLQYLGHLISGESTYHLKKAWNNTWFSTPQRSNWNKTYNGTSFLLQKSFANVSDIVKPLIEPTNKNTAFNWNPHCEQHRHHQRNTDQQSNIDISRPKWALCLFYTCF